LLAVFFTANSQAVTINATKIGPIFTTTPIAETAWQALSQFRGQFTPVNVLVVAANVVLINKIGDGINALRAEMASPLPAAQSPVGWATSETPPSVGTLTATYTYSGYSSPDAYCAANYASGWLSVLRNAPADYGCINPANSSDIRSGSSNKVASSSSCEAGYTLSGSTCNLTTPAAVKWPSDGIPTVKPINGVLTPAPRDPDNTGLSPGNIERTGTDDYGNPVRESVSTNAQNWIDYKRDSQSVNPVTGEPQVQRDQFTTDQNGVVQSSTSNIYNNSTISNVSTSTVAPTDISTLAKDATLTATNTKLDLITTKLSSTPPAMVAPSSVRTIDQSNQLVKTAFLSQMPPVNFSDTVPECPVFTAFIPFLNFTMTIDQLCTMDYIIRPVLNIASMVFFTFSAALMVLGA